ncbi:MAG TPA: EamA family transporter, partial [Candidatus Limnocylindrales bacterium]|nr:EamA family transporter [Candidatus Limnocylindrales bacterium]
MTIIQRYLPYLAGVGVAFAWGLSFMFTRDALDHATPFHLLGLRFLTALTVMGLIRALGLIKIKVSKADYRSLLPLAFLQPILYFATETNGILLTSASYAGMMIAIIPVFTIILSVFVLKEYPTRLQVFFILASVTGVIFVVYMDNKSAFGANPIGTLALLGAVTAAACYNITSRKASVSHPPLQITWVMMVVGAIVFNGISLTQHAVNGNLNLYFAPLATIWPAVFYLGIFASIIAFFLYNYMLSKITAAQGSVFANLVTV